MDKLYIRSASNDGGYCWYKFENGKTIPYDVGYEPEAWERVNNLLVSTKPCLAIVNLNQELSCIFTGILSERKAGSRLIYDTVIITNSNSELSDLQKKLINVFLSADISDSPLNSLSKAVKDNGIKEIIIDEGNFKDELNKLCDKGSDFVTKNQYLFPDDIVRDSSLARNSLIQKLMERLPQNNEDKVLSVVTKHKSPELLKDKVIWGITDYSTARKIEDVVPRFSQEKTDEQFKRKAATSPESKEADFNYATKQVTYSNDEINQTSEPWRITFPIPFSSRELVLEVRNRKSEM